MLQQRSYTFALTNLSLSCFACNKAADHTFRVQFYRGALQSSLHMSTKVPVATRIQPEDVTMKIVSFSNCAATINGAFSGDHA